MWLSFSDVVRIFFCVCNVDVKLLNVDSTRFIYAGVQLTSTGTWYPGYSETSEVYILASTLYELSVGSLGSIDPL